MPLPKTCFNCRHFEAPNACHRIRAYTEYNFTCEEWTARYSARGDEYRIRIGAAEIMEPCS